MKTLSKSNILKFIVTALIIYFVLFILHSGLFQTFRIGIAMNIGFILISSFVSCCFLD